MSEYYGNCKPAKGCGDYTGMWLGKKIRSINDRPFYPHITEVSVRNPNPKGPVKIWIPNPDYKPHNAPDDYAPMPEAEFQASMRQYFPPESHYEVEESIDKPIVPLPITDSITDKIKAKKKSDAKSKITNLNWSDKRFTPGKTVHQIFTVTNCQKGDCAIISVVECDVNGQQQEIDTIEISLDTGDGQYQNAWQRSVKDAEADMKADGVSGESGPLEYKYRVSVGDVVSTDSKTLLMRTTYEVIINSGEGVNAKAIKNEAYTVKKNDEQIGKGVTSGQGGIVLQCVDSSATYTVDIMDNVITVIPG